MSAYRVLPAAIAAAFLLAALPAIGAAAAQDSPSSTEHHGGGMRAMMGTFTPEQMAMLMIQMRSDTAGMTPDQRRAYRETERNKMMTMSAADKAKMVADLQAKWDALPADQKSEALDRIQKMKARRAAGGGWGHGDNGGDAQ